MRGLFVPLVTPFDRAGAVALDALEALAHEVLDAGASGVVALGTTGEPGTLTAAEQRSVIDTVVRVCGERGARLIVGANSPEALDALAALASRADAALASRADAALSLVPPFVRPGEAGVLAYIAELAKRSPVPLLVYDIPYRTGQYLTVETLRRLADIPGVAGLKYSPGGINADTVALLADPPPGFAILGGEDVFISPLLALGAHGGILASAHVATAEFARLIAAWHAGDVETARPLGGRLSTLSAALFAEPNPTVVKAVLHAQGRIPTASVRLPLLPASNDATTVALDRLDAFALT